jgi:hypothetical protein
MEIRWWFEWDFLLRVEWYWRCMGLAIGTGVVWVFGVMGYDIG